MTPEKTIQNAILRAYATRPWLRIWRQNTGMAQYSAVDGSHRTVRFGLPGQADLSGILNDGRRLEIEVKTARGRQSEQQQNYQRMIERFGGVYILARSVEDVTIRLQHEGYAHD